MGADKALIEVGGAPMGRRCVAVLTAIGCDPVLLVGATARHEPLGGRPVPDDVAGGGPAAAVATALRRAGGAQVLIVPTDLPRLDTEALEPLLDAARRHPEADLVAATVGGRRQLPLGVWSGGLRLPAPAELAGTSLRVLVAGLGVVDVDCDDRLRDADEPDDLQRGAEPST